MSSLEKVWEHREERLYPQLFGTSRRGIFPLPFELFKDTFAQADVDPRWLQLGVFEFAPTESRDSWLYVTSGGSTPWDDEPSDYDPDEYSWLGVEFVIEVVEQADWPIRALQRILGYHVLICHERYGETPPLDYGARIPAGGAIDGSKTSQLRFFAIGEPKHYPALGQLDSGKFDFLHIVGITEEERDFAKKTSTKKLVSKLAKQGVYPVTDPNRKQISL
jgi:hypothetical protein